MKEIKAIVQPHMLERVMSVLHSFSHFPGVTVSDCQGQGRGRGTGGRFESTQETVFFKKMTKVELFCSDAIATQIVDAIRHAAHTGNPGDGVIMVQDLTRVVRIRTGEVQDDAV